MSKPRLESGSREFRFSQVDQNQYRDGSGRWVVERSFREGPRGGRQTEWVLYEWRAGRLHEVAIESRLGDLWQHIPEDRPE